MKIRLIPLGCKIPNLALMKLSAWHKGQGDIVSLDEPEPDKVYVSSPFLKYKGYNYTYMFPGAEIEYGGYGFNKNKLPDEIEHIMPDYDMFDCNYSMGFTSRGCIRNCSFCKVHEMEGMIKNNSHVSEFHDKRFNKMVLLDNNFLASPDWEQNLQYIIDHKIEIDINSGLDIRLINDHNSGLLSMAKLKPVRFAFDDSGYRDSVIQGIETLIRNGIKPYRMRVYIIAYPFELEDVYNRFKLLDHYKIDAFVMIYNNLKTDPQIREFARWVNKRIHRTCAFENYNK